MIKIQSVVFWGMWDKEGQEDGIANGHGKAFGGDRCMHYIDCGDNFRGAWHVKSHDIKHFKYVPFLYI